MNNVRSQGAVECTDAEILITQDMGNDWRLVVYELDESIDQMAIVATAYVWRNQWIWAAGNGSVSTCPTEQLDMENSEPIRRSNAASVSSCVCANYQDQSPIGKPAWESTQLAVLMKPVTW